MVDLALLGFRLPDEEGDGDGDGEGEEAEGEAVVAEEEIKGNLGEARSDPWWEEEEEGESHLVGESTGEGGKAG